MVGYMPTSKCYHRVGGLLHDTSFQFVGIFREVFAYGSHRDCGSKIIYRLVDLFVQQTEVTNPLDCRIG